MKLAWEKIHNDNRTFSRLGAWHGNVDDGVKPPGRVMAGSS